MYFSSGLLLEQMRSGQIRGLPASGPKRDHAAPEFADGRRAGVPGFDVTGWYAMLAPAKTPPEIVKRMHADTAPCWPTPPSSRE